MKIRDILDFFESQVPLNQQDEWDNSGVQVGNTEHEIRGVLVAVDATEEVIEEAVKEGCNLIIAHHPLLFHATKQITPDYYVNRCVIEAIRHDITIYAAHTNLDNNPKGVNHFWAEKIGLLDTKPIMPTQSEPKVGAGIIGVLPEAISIDELICRMKSFQPIERIAHSEILEENVRVIAYCGGSGAFLMKEAARLGADVFITGEAKYNDYYDAHDLLTLMTLGHFESEELTKNLIYNVLCQKRGNFVVRCSSSCKNPVKYI